MTYHIVVTPAVLTILDQIRDLRIRDQLQKKIDGLVYEPEKQGKPLAGELAGLRSIRAVGQRYRILYRVERSKILVMIITLGVRKEGDKKDVYELAKKLIRLKLIK